MASRRNRRTLKRQSKRIKGGIFEFLYSSTPQPQNATPAAPASTGSSLWWPFSSSTQSTQPPPPPPPPPQRPSAGGKRMRKTSKRQSRR